MESQTRGRVAEVQVKSRIRAGFTPKSTGAKQAIGSQRKIAFTRSQTLVIISLAIAIGTAGLLSIEEKGRTEQAGTKIKFYSRSNCPYCLKTRTFFSGRGLVFEEIELGNSPERFAEMVTNSKGSSTVPQIFFGSQHIGGFDDLMELAYEGKVDKTLNDNASP